MLGGVHGAVVVDKLQGLRDSELGQVLVTTLRGVGVGVGVGGYESKRSRGKGGVALVLPEERLN